MKRVGSILAQSLAFLAVITLSSITQAQQGPQHPGEAREKANGTTHKRDQPQDFVLCTGWHALCSASHDCKVNGDMAACDCLRVNEIHIIMTGEIQDTLVKRQTLGKCTYQDPCTVDAAPICKAIKSGQYKVNNVRYDWVSTYSYRGWCGLLTQNLVSCDPTVQGYTGDAEWAICDLAPCTEKQNPSDPEKPLSCQCRVVRNVPFVGTNGSCTGDNGGIISSMAASGWDFPNNTYTFPMPGYEYVQGACAPLKSDPWKE